MLLLEDCLPWLGIWVQRFPFTEEKGGGKWQPVTALPKSAVSKCEKRTHTEASGDFDMAHAFKDTVEGCSIPLALQAESKIARERREEEQEDCLQRLL